MAARKTDEEILYETWNEFGRLFKYAQHDPKPGQVVGDGVLTPRVLVRELERRSGHTGWHVVFNWKTGKFDITPPGSVRERAAAMRVN